MPLPRPDLDLLTEPWITVADLTAPSAAQRRVGLRELFDRAHELVVCHTGVEEAVLMRLLAAVYDAAAGPRTTSEWDGAWAAPTLDTDRIGAYFDCWHDRFDALHPRRPFLQCGALDAPSHNVGQLNLGRANSTASSAFFERRLARGMDQHPPMEPAEAFLAALVMLGYDVAGMKTPHPADTRGKYGNPVGVLASITHAHLGTGGPLKDTLLLSLPPAPRAEGDAPAWERPDPAPAHTVREPAGRLDLLTWPSRRIRLFLADDGLVHDIACYPGDRLADRSWPARREIDPMAAWALSRKKGKSWYPASTVNQVGFPVPWAGASLLGTGYCPAVAHVVAACERGVLAPGLPVSVTMVRVEHTDPKQSVISSIDPLTAPLGLAGTLAGPDRREGLAALADLTTLVQHRLAHGLAAITAKSTAAVQAATAPRDLSPEWAEVAFADDPAAAVREWVEAISGQIDSAPERMRLPAQQRVLADALCREVRGLLAQGLAESPDTEEAPRAGRPSGQYEAFGRWMTLTELASHPDAKVGYHTIRRRIQKGMDPQEAATTPGHRGRTA